MKAQKLMLAAATGVETSATWTSTISKHAATIAQWMLNNAMYACPILLLVAGIILLILYWEQISAWIMTAAKAIGDFFRPAIEWLMGGFNFLRNIIINLIKLALIPVLLVIGSLRRIFEWLGKHLSGPFAAALSVVKRMFQMWWDVLVQGYNVALKPVVDFLKWIAGGLFNVALQVMVGLWDGLVSGLKAVWEWLKPIWDALKWIADNVADAFGNIGGAFGGAAEFAGFQHGGIVTRPTIGLLGEAGPEMIVPLTGGRAPGFGSTTNYNIGEVRVIVEAHGGEVDMDKFMKDFTEELEALRHAEG